MIDQVRAPAWNTVNSGYIIIAHFSRASLVPPSSIHRRVLRIAWPLTLANLSVPLVGLVDTAILGHLDRPTYLAAVAAGASVMTLLFWLFSFLRTGTTSVTARAHGARHGNEVTDTAARAMAMAMLLGLLMILFARPLVDVALHFIAPEAEVRALAREYGLIRIFSAPAILGTYVLIGWMVALQSARRALLVMLVTNLLNLLLDLILIVGLGLNSRGAAIASLGAEWSGFLLAAWLALDLNDRVGTRLRSAALTVRESYAELLRVNGDLFVRSACVLFALTFFTAQGARQGEVTLAANAIMLQLLLLFANGLDGLANAAEALTGQAYGAGRIRRLRLVTRSAFLWSWLIVALTTAIFALVPELIVSLFTSLTSVQEIALEHFAWLVLVPLVSVGCFVLDGVFLGTGLSRSMRNIMIGALILVYLPLWWSTRSLGNHGLWLTLVAFFLARSIAMWIWYRHRFPPRRVVRSSLEPMPPL